MSSPFPLPADWGWDLSHYVHIPDQFFDLFLPHLCPSEMTVLLYVFRRTLGFRKTQDAISQSQLLNGIPGKDRGTGLHRETLRRALKALQEKRLLLRRRNKSASGRDLPSCYCLPIASAVGARHAVPLRGGPSSYSLPIASPCRIRPPDPVESAQGGGAKCSPWEGLSNPPPQDTEIQIYKRGSPPGQAASPSRQGRRARQGWPGGRAGTPPASTAGPSDRVVVASEAKQSRLSEKEPKLPTFESDSLKKRWERIFAWWNSRWPLDESTPYERRLAYREMERLVRDPGFEPPPPGWRPPTFEEVVQKFGIAQERR